MLFRSVPTLRLYALGAHREQNPAQYEKSLKEQGFDSRRADEEDIKRILAVYYEQNVTSEKFEDFDGARWIIPDD